MQLLQLALRLHLARARLKKPHQDSMSQLRSIPVSPQNKQVTKKQISAFTMAFQPMLYIPTTACHMIPLP